MVVAYRHGSSSGGPLNAFSYNANFTNTTGRLSAQFGLHYVNFSPKVNNETAHGVGASGVALFVFPVAGRWEDGVPKAAFSFYVGSVPTIYISGERNYLTVPLTLGLGVPLSPHKAITFTPWFEMAPSANLDTIFKPANITTNCSSDPSSCVTINADGSVSLKEGAIEAAVKQGVTIDTSFSVPMRAGLNTEVHLGESADLNLYASIGSLGGGFGGATLGFLGGGLTFRWDDIVPAVLPVERRLEREDCDAIESRFRSCPNSRNWHTPEQRAREMQAPVAPKAIVPTGPTPVPPAPKPAAPALTPSVTPAPTPAPAPAVSPEPAPPVSGPPSAQFPTPN